MSTIETDLIQQPPTGGATDVEVVVAINADGTAIGGASVVDGNTITTDLIQNPATGGAKDVRVVIAVNPDGTPIQAGTGGGELPTGEQYQVMGFNATTGKPEARKFLSQMWGDLTTAFPLDGGWVAILLNDGSHAFTAADYGVVANSLPVRDEGGRINTAKGIDPDDAVNMSQLAEIALEVDDQAATVAAMSASVKSASDGVNGCLTKAEFNSKFVNISTFPANPPNIPDYFYTSAIVHHVDRSYEPTYFRIKPFTDTTTIWNNCIPTYNVDGQLKTKDATGNGQAVSFSQFNIRFPVAMRTAINELVLEVQDFTSLSQASVAVRKIINALKAGQL